MSKTRERKLTGIEADEARAREALRLHISNEWLNPVELRRMRGTADGFAWDLADASDGPGRGCVCGHAAVTMSGGDIGERTVEHVRSSSP